MTDINSIQGGRHRAPGRPRTPFSSFGQTMGGTARRGVLAAASSALAITMAATTASAEPAEGDTHTVRSGDTVAELAQQYGSSVSSIAAANDLSNPDLIHVGQTLYVSGSAEATATANGTHTVKAGDTVAKLAQRYGVSIAGIVAANDLADPNLIHVGQKLDVSGRAPAPAPAQEASTSGQSTSQESSAPRAQAADGTHTVRAGDTVAKLAQRYGVSVSGIVAANDLSSASVIHVGQRLDVTGQATQSANRTESASQSRASTERSEPAAERSQQAASRSTTREAPQKSQAAAPSSASGVVNIARQYIGTPYAWGGSTPAAFDCSGFTAYVYAQAGIDLPRSSGAQRSAGTQVSASAAQPGDLVWWPGHVGIYTGGGKYIAAHSPGTPLSERDMYKANPTFIRVG